MTTITDFANTTATIPDIINQTSDENDSSRYDADPFLHFVAPAIAAKKFFNGTATQINRGFNVGI